MKATAIRPITDLKNRTKEVVQQVTDGDPVVITQNGKPKVVVMDVKQHERLQETLAMLKVLAQSQDSLARTGRVFSTDEVRRRAHAVLERAAGK